MDQFLRFPGFRLKALTLSYDDGTIHDRRLVEIMKKYGIIFLCVSIQKEKVFL